MVMAMRPWALAVVLALVSGVAQADAPYDDRLAGFAKTVLKKRRGPEAVLALLRMQRYGQDADPLVRRKLYQEIADSKRVDGQLRMQARHRLAWDLRRTGRPEESKRAFDALGYVRGYRILGPFDNEGKRGFEAEQPPEAEQAEPRNLDAVYQGREHMVKWREIPDVVRGGYVSFDALFSPSDNVCAFAETTVDVPEAGPITLWAGAGGAFKLYFNGEEVLRDEAYRGAYPNRHAVAVQAHKGNNRLLMKVCTMAGGWGFYLRTADVRGEALALTAKPEAVYPVAAVEKAKGKRARAPKTWLEELQKKAEAKRARPDALENYARFLYYSAADDMAEHWARAHAIRAATAKPTVSRLLLASYLSKERHEKMRFIAQAEKLAPDDVSVRMARASITRSGAAPERALGMLTAIEDKGTAGLDAARGRASMLTALGLPQAALSVLNQPGPRTAGSLRWQWARAEALRALGRKREAMELTQKIHTMYGDHVASRRTIFRHAVRRGDTAHALQIANELRVLYPAHASRLQEVARMYEAAGRDDLKFAALTDLIELNPQAPRAHVAQGRALLQAERYEAAAESFRAALALAPQDAETRELLEQLSPEPRLDESYAVDRDTLLARRTGPNGHPVTSLTDLTVNTVYENGLGSRFVQFAAEAHDSEGARQLRTRSIQFDPETQRVDIRLARVYRKNGRVLDATQTYERPLGEPWYRIYYDTRALVVVFPDIEPGDSIELRYRVDDVAHRNLFADYYGDMHFLQGGEPRKHVEYVLIAPAKRTLYFNEPKMQGLVTDVTEKDSLRIHRYWADDVPAIKPEPSMPGLTEFVPHLHVSTYKTWKEVGHWYWGLIKDQLHADDALKATVAELKKGAKDRRELVERIYGWVVKNTRYVGLEFGIHGFLPYRVPEIVKRGFGDCKDKASLIYTMMREAGVEARIVLVRTRDNGGITELPASLSVFNHAIAYVPEFDLFLDGTAEHSGTRELPFGDQGVTVLVVGPDSAELRKTPVMPSKANRRDRKFAITMARDGSASMDVENTVRGGDAAGYRSRYEAVGTQAERLERSLAQRYPGLSLERHAFSGLSDLESDIGLTYSLRVPQLAEREGDNLRFAPSGMTKSLLRSTARTPERTYPLELGARYSYHEERRVRLPKGFRASAVPAGGNADSRFGSLSLKVSQHGEEVISETLFEFKVDRVSAEDYPEFRGWVESADRLLQQRITLSPESR